MATERTHLEYARRCATGLTDEGDHVGGQSVDAVCDEVERLRLVVEENDRLIDGLTAIVDRLPDTEDKVKILPGMTLWKLEAEGTTFADGSRACRDVTVQFLSWPMDRRKKQRMTFAVEEELDDFDGSMFFSTKEALERYLSTQAAAEAAGGETSG